MCFKMLGNPTLVRPTKSLTIGEEFALPLLRDVVVSKQDRSGHEPWTFPLEDFGGPATAEDTTGGYTAFVENLDSTEIPAKANTPQVLTDLNIEDSDITLKAACDDSAFHTDKFQWPVIKCRIIGILPETSAYRKGNGAYLRFTTSSGSFDVAGVLHFAYPCCGTPANDQTTSSSKMMYLFLDKGVTVADVNNVWSVDTSLTSISYTPGKPAAENKAVSFVHGREATSHLRVGGTASNRDYHVYTSIPMHQQTLPAGDTLILRHYTVVGDYNDVHSRSDGLVDGSHFFFSVFFHFFLDFLSPFPSPLCNLLLFLFSSSLPQP